ncbi:MAG: helix-turn-helix transcriptional regulator [Acidimicrobiales bacterium]
MRADRLVAILLLLQQRDQVTAAEVAAELEVSERTARRDLDALGVAGLPIYSIQGRNGGWRLLGGGTTDLSGLTAPEARALFLVAGPASTATPEVRAALRKLVRALPEPFRADAEAASGAVVVDPGGWDGTAPYRSPAPPLLDAVQQAVIGAQQLHLTYIARDGTTSERAIPSPRAGQQGHPLVPGGRYRARATHLPSGPDPGGDAHRRRRGPTPRLRSR